MEEAIGKARTAGVGVVGVARSNHFGEGAYYALEAIRQDMIGILTTNGSANTPPHGGRSMVAGNLPLTVGVPADEEVPVLLDMAICAPSSRRDEAILTPRDRSRGTRDEDLSPRYGQLQRWGQRLVARGLRMNTPGKEVET